MGKENQQDFSDKVLRNDRLDLVKAISISLVLVWHLHPITLVSEEQPGILFKIAFFILSNSYLNFTLIAVPLFILSSLFLLFQKLQISGYEYLLKRCKRLLEIFSVWSIIQIFIYYSVQLIQSIRSTTPFSWHIDDLNIYNFFTGAKPPLPLVGDSVFYFILILLELVIISYVLFFWKINKLKNYISTAIIVVTLVYFEALNLTGTYIPYWRIDNFLIYIPIAYFLANRGGKVARKHIITFYMCFLVFGLQDIFLGRIGYEVGTYCRVSIICGAVAVFSSCLNLENWKASDSVKFLSRFSLGIFALHKYWQLVITFAVVKLFQLLSLSTNILKIDTSAIFIAIATTFFTFGSVYLLNRSPFQRFIR